MAAPIYLPEKKSPWTQFMPYMMQMMMGNMQAKREEATAAQTAKTQHGYKMKQIEAAKTQSKPSNLKLTDQGLIYVGGKGEIQVDERFKKSPDYHVSTHTDASGKVSVLRVNKRTGALETKLDVGKIGKPLVGRTLQDIPTKGEGETLREQEIATRQVINLGEKMKQQIKTDPTIVGLVGGTKRFVDSAISQVQLATKSLGGTAIINGRRVSETALLNPKLYKFSESIGGAVLSAQLKANIIRLSYVIARAQEPGGRLSDRDVQAGADQLAGGSGSPAQMLGTIDNMIDNAKSAYGSYHMVYTGKELPEGFLGEGKVVNKQLPGQPKSKGTTIRYDITGNRIE